MLRVVILNLIIIIIAGCSQSKKMMSLDEFRNNSSSCLRLKEDSTFAYRYSGSSDLISGFYKGNGNYVIEEDSLKLNFKKYENRKARSPKIFQLETANQVDSVQITIFIRDSLWDEKIKLHNLRVSNHLGQIIIEEARIEYPSKILLPKKEFPVEIVIDSWGYDTENINLKKEGNYKIYCGWTTSETKYERLIGEVSFKLSKKNSKVTRLICYEIERKLNLN
jgi:hypothetical protein